MARITIKGEVSNKELKREIPLVVDTGADMTAIKESTLKEIGLRKKGWKTAINADGSKKRLPVYRVILKVEGCSSDTGIDVLGTKGNNLLGHDMLQIWNARVDEKNKRLECPINL